MLYRLRGDISRSAVHISRCGAGHTQSLTAQYLHVLQLCFVALDVFFGQLGIGVIARVIAAMTCRFNLVVVPACTSLCPHRHPNGWQKPYT